MPCIFCIAAMSVAAATIVPALIDSLEEKLRGSASDLTRLVDSQSTTQWQGTVTFQALDGRPRQAPVKITIYKPSKRARIQIMSHDLAPADCRLLEDHVAGLLSATIVSRHDAHTGETVTEPVRADAEQEAAQRLRVQAPERPGRQ